MRGFGIASSFFPISLPGGVERAVMGRWAIPKACYIMNPLFLRSHCCYVKHKKIFGTGAFLFSIQH